MNNTVRNVVMLVVVALALTGLSLAQDVTDRVTANIPFSFDAGSQHLPAGIYQFAVNEQDHTVTLANTATGRSSWMPSLAFDGGLPGNPEVDFDVIGGTHVLANLRTYNAGVHFLEQKAEVAAVERGESVAILASLR